MQLLGVILENVFLTLTRVTQDDCMKQHVKKGKEKYGLLAGQWRLNSWRQAFGYTFVVWRLSMTLPAYVEGRLRPSHFRLLTGPQVENKLKIPYKGYNTVLYRHNQTQAQLG